MVDSTDIQAGRYKAYPEYKDSGVEWLGEIPSGWEVVPIKHLADLTPKKPKKTKDLLSEECSFIPMEKLKLDKLELDETKLISEVLDGYTYFENDDVLIAKVTPCFENKNMAVASNLRNGIGFGSSEIYVLRADKKAHNRYLFYRLQESVFMSIAISNMTGAGGLRRVPADTINNYSIAIPAKSEQEQISSFLDHETAKIDTLIEKQQRLIELLTEKRQAVISHAVTKGLNPDVPMKDSGVEWLGEVPAHWELPKLIQQTSRIGDGLHSTPKYQDNTGYYFVNGNNLVDGQIIIGVSAKEVPEDEYTKHFIPLDETSVLLSINGTIGNVARYRGEKVILGKSAAYMNCSNQLTPEYLILYLQSSQVRHYFDLEVTGTTIYNLSLNSLRQMKVCIPSKSEQLDIDSYCNAQKNKYDSLIGKANLQIQLMQERRTALISAAVTGKIDVRDWVKPE